MLNLDPSTVRGQQLDDRQRLERLRALAGIPPTEFNRWLEIASDHDIEHWATLVAQAWGAEQP